MDSSGNIYGIAVQGGADSHGTVFQLNPNGSGYSFSVLHTFTGGNDGGQPYSNLVMDSNGNLYGTTTIDGANGAGTAYEITPSSNTFTTIYSFQFSGGYNPIGKILIDSAGNLYGVTEYGGSGNKGTAFELSPSGTGGFNLTTLHNFSGSDGATPLGGLTADSMGNIYGTTGGGGTSGDGTIFELQGAISGLTATTASNVSVPFSTNAQNVTLTANVSSGSGTVNEGTVTFTVLQGSTVIGQVTTSDTVSNGQASVSYALPASLAAGTYTIDAVYNSGPDFSGSSDTTHTLTVLLAPTVTTNPSNQTVTAGQTATFTAAANGSPTPTVQWQVRSNGATTWTDIGGATSTTLTLNNVLFSQNGNEYRAVFTNSAGSATTTAATLTVQTQPVITSGNNATFTIGQGGSFTVTTTGAPTPTLTESGALPSGIAFTDNGNGTGTLSGTPAAGTNATYHFTISATNSAGSLNQSFTLTVNPAPAPPSPPRPPVLNVPPLLALIDSLLGGTEKVNANGTETIAYSLFGITLIAATYDDSGNFVSATLLGISVPNWVWSL